MSKVMKHAVNVVKAAYANKLHDFQNSWVFDLANRVAHSTWYDLLGCAIVVIGCYVAHWFSETIYTTQAWQAGSIVAHNPISIWVAGLIPFGFISVFSALNSLMSDRLESRLSNWGNWIGIPSIILSCYIDFMLGNRAAPFTYSITFIIQIIAVAVWHYTGKYNVNRPKLRGLKGFLVLLVASAASFAFAYWADVYGYGAQYAHGAIFWTSTVAFAISMIANIAEMFKFQFNNKAWIVYNVVQMIKAVAQHNTPYIFKYGYYFVNNAVSLASWSDKGRSDSSKAETAKKVNRPAKQLA